MRSINFPAMILILSLACVDPAAGARSETSRHGLHFSHTASLYTNPFHLTIQGDRPDVSIVFTLDGSPPTASSQRWPEQGLRVDRTTALRAAAHVNGGPPAPAACRTFIFPEQVLRQTGEGFPVVWGTNNGRPVVSDYEMDPEVVNAPAYRGEVANALKSLPSLSLVLDPADLFDPSFGIYSNPKESGDAWERPASIELIYPDGRRGYQLNCGIRIHGGWNRRPEESPKHSFRLVFRKKYGAGKLKFPLFGAGAPAEFDTLVLRGGCNNTWLHWSGTERGRGDFIRDQWTRETARAMGQPAAAGFFAHLYLNGLYWGLYNVCERPSAPFAAAYLGGAPENYDSMNAGKVLEGDKRAWNEMMELVNAGLDSEPAWNTFQTLMDVPALIDYLIVNFYGANADWDRASNWYSARRRQPPGRFYFFVWDAERTLEGVNDNSMEFDDDQSPPRLFQRLRTNPEFRLLFADRVQKHLFDNGALAPAAAARRFKRFADEIDPAVVAESARWGDYRRDVHPYKVGPYELYTRDDHWRPEVKRLLEHYFPARTTVLLQQFRSAGLYPGVKPPSLTAHTTAVELSSLQGDIYFTLDGTDPRLPGGRVSGAAHRYTSPIPRSTPGTLKARVVTGAPRPEWSALLSLAPARDGIR